MCTACYIRAEAVSQLSWKKNSRIAREIFSPHRLCALYTASPAGKRSAPMLRKKFPPCSETFLLLMLKAGSPFFSKTGYFFGIFELSRIAKKSEKTRMRERVEFKMQPSINQKINMSNSARSLDTRKDGHWPFHTNPIGYTECIRFCKHFICIGLPSPVVKCSPERNAAFETRRSNQKSI